jgi:hypothetical protein
MTVSVEHWHGRAYYGVLDVKTGWAGTEVTAFLLVISVGNDSNVLSIDPELSS